MYKPGGNYFGHFITRDNTDFGTIKDADSLPVCIGVLNGADDGTFTLTVTKIATGRYKVTGTVPVGYSVGDRVQIVALATVSTKDGGQIVDDFMIDSAYTSDVDIKILDVQNVVSNMLTINETTSELELWNAAGDAIISTWPLTDKNSDAIALQVGPPSNRGKRVII